MPHSHEFLFSDVLDIPHIRILLYENVKIIACSCSAPIKQFHIVVAVDINLPVAKVLCWKLPSYSIV